MSKHPLGSLGQVGVGVAVVQVVEGCVLVGAVDDAGVLDGGADEVAAEVVVDVL